MKSVSIHPLVDHAVWYAAKFCFGLPFPINGFRRSRVLSMPDNIREFAIEVGAGSDCYTMAEAMVRMFPDELLYVVGFVANPYPMEHAWVRFDRTEIYYDPTMELSGSVYPDYVPMFAVSSSELASEMSERESDLPPVLTDLVWWTNKRWFQSRQTVIHSGPVK